MQQFRMTTALGDHMVLQRDTAVRLWGKGATPGGEIHAQIGPYEGWGVAAFSGAWEVFLPPMPANTVPQILTITHENESITAQDVLVGDVWVINGQSNADATLGACNRCGNGLYEAYFDDLREEDHIRVLNQTRDIARDNPESMTKPQFDLVDPAYSSWRPLAGRETSEVVSALGFFFARRLSRTLGGSIPIGLVTAASGGSPMMELIMPEMIEPMNYTAPEKDTIPLAGIYNALMAPIQKMTISGMLFYQGESEQKRFRKYAYQLKWYVEELRRRNGCVFPFYFVQLSSHCGEGVKHWTRIGDVRCVQETVTEILEDAYMVVAMDVGGQETDRDWAHPPYKQPIGERAADLALAQQYAIGDVWYVSSPAPADCLFGEDYVKIAFVNVGDGLQLLEGKRLTGFEVKNGDGDYVKARGHIDRDGATVVLRGAANPTGVRYGHMDIADHAHANLASSSGLPCVAFERLKEE